MWRPAWLLMFLLMTKCAYSQQGSDEVHFVIDICSYNNENWCLANLKSVFFQRYHNFHVIFTDDCSTDGTGDIVANFVRERGLEDKVTIIRNKTRRRQMANHYRVAQMCNDDDVIVVLDGDDWFAHGSLLKRLNKIYQNEQVWMTYGQFKNWPTNERGYCTRTSPEVISNNDFRNFRWRWGHLRTYRAWLAKLVKLEDLVITDIKNDNELGRAPGRPITPKMLEEVEPHKGKFFPASADLAFGHPMLEMAGFHVKYIPSILYIRNVGNLLNTFKTQSEVQQYCARYIRSKERYQKLSQPVKRQRPIRKIMSVDIVIFMQAGVQELACLASSIEYQLRNYGKIYVVYDSSRFSSDKINTLKKVFSSNATYLDSDNNGISSLVQKLHASKNQYVFVCEGTETISSSFNLASCARMLERTFAHSFYLEAPKDNPDFIQEWTGLGDVWFAQFGSAQENYYPFSLSLALYHKETLIKALQDCQKITLSDLPNHCKNLSINKKKIGLFMKKTE